MQSTLSCVLSFVLVTSALSLHVTMVIVMSTVRSLIVPVYVSKCILFCCLSFCSNFFLHVHNIYCHILLFFALYSTEKRILNIVYRASCTALTILDTKFNYFLYCIVTSRSILNDHDRT